MGACHFFALLKLGISMAVTSEPSVSLNVEIPEALYDSLQDYLESHESWSSHRLFCASLSLFLMQNGTQDRRVNRLYLDALFDYTAA
jgi:hypothetical protein